jgi:hypothetical protein
MRLFSRRICFDHSFVNASSKSMEEIISNLKTIPTQKTSHSYATKFSLRLQVSPGYFTQDKSESARQATRNLYALKPDIRFQCSSDKSEETYLVRPSKLVGSPSECQGRDLSMGV